MFTLISFLEAECKSINLILYTGRPITRELIECVLFTFGALLTEVNVCFCLLVVRLTAFPTGVLSYIVRSFEFASTSLR